MNALESLVDRLKEDRRLNVQMIGDGVYEVTAHLGKIVSFGSLSVRDGITNFLFYPFITQDEHTSAEYARLRQDVLGIFRQYRFRQQPIKESLETDPKFRARFDAMIKDAADLLIPTDVG